MRSVLPDLLLIAGLAVATYGVSKIYAPAAYIFLGGMLFLLGLAPALVRMLRPGHRKG